MELNSNNNIKCSTGVVNSGVVNQRVQSVWPVESSAAQGSENQELSSIATGSSTRNRRTRPFAGLTVPSDDGDYDDDSFTSSTPMSPTPPSLTPSSLPSSYGAPIVISGLQPKRKKLSRLDPSPPVPSTQLDSKVYEFLDKCMERSKEPVLTGYPKKIRDFCNVLGDMMVEIPEKSFSTYMQESIKTLEHFQPQDTLVYVTPPALDVTNVSGPSILNLTTGTFGSHPFNSNSSNSNLTTTTTTVSAEEFLNYQQNQQLQLSQQINNIAANQIPLSKIITDNFAPDTQNTENTQVQGEPPETNQVVVVQDSARLQDSEDDDGELSDSIISNDALLNDGQRIG